MPRRLTACLIAIALTFVAGVPPATAADYESQPGFMDLHWDATGGRLLLGIEAFDTPFIYQSSLPRGVGSNDIGLDRGQLGATAVVRFVRSGPKVLLIEDNLSYRALSDDDEEREAVDESFARSVLWGFEVAEEAGGTVRIDATDFLLRDSHSLGATLRDRGEGDYSVDASRSAIYMPRTRAFPDNTEIEAIVTLVGNPAGIGRAHV